jgi:hypothetical protein
LLSVNPLTARVVPVADAAVEQPVEQVGKVTVGGSVYPEPPEILKPETVITDEAVALVVQPALQVKVTAG